eukprot:7230982-Prymnesium_polylepis.1
MLFWGVSKSAVPPADPCVHACETAAVATWILRGRSFVPESLSVFVRLSLECFVPSPRARACSASS